MLKSIPRTLVPLAAWALIATLLGCEGAKHVEEVATPEAPDSLIRVPHAALAGGGIAVMEIREEEIIDQLSLAGQVQADPLRIGHVAPRVRGTIQSIGVVIGDQVRRGQVLGTLWSPE